MKISYKSISTAALILGFASLIIFSLLFWIKSLPFDFLPPLDTDRLDHFGSLIGGLVGALFSLASILLLIHTIREQELDSRKQKIESRFFELLKIHRENCSEIALSDRTGRIAIPRLVREVRVCLKLAEELNVKMNMAYNEEKVINFSYLFFWFGCRGPQSQLKIDTFKRYINDYDPQFTDEFVKNCLENYEQLKNEGNFDDRFMLGHQIRLGHYFRHLFQMVTYINNQTIISFGDKYNYIKTLRAQLSSHEQILLYFNVLSVLGYEWEKNYPNEPNKQLITKYNLIKNILYVGTIEKHFPCIEFENKPTPLCREALQKIYT